VTSDRIAELGAEDGDAFLPIEKLQLLDPVDGPAGSPELINRAPLASPALDRLPRVRAITVNTAHGDPRSIAAAVERFAPQVESMEGAAFMYACLVAGVPYAQVRAVSNVVERRNRAAWRIAEAVRVAAETGRGVIEGL
jgi:futalosine hydrolase